MTPLITGKQELSGTVIRSDTHLTVLRFIKNDSKFGFVGKFGACLDRYIFA